MATSTTKRPPRGASAPKARARLPRRLRLLLALLPLLAAMTAECLAAPPVLYPKWHDLVAGAAAGLGARAITAPLDLLKIRRQLSAGEGGASKGAAKAIPEWNIPGQLLAIARREGGAAALFRGNVAASYLWMGYNVAQFGLYGRSSDLLVRLYLARHPGADPASIAPAVSFASGAFAGLCATLVTYPFDLCRTVFAARGVDTAVPASNVTWSDKTTERLAASRRDGPVNASNGRPPRTMLEFARELHRQRGAAGFLAGAGPGLLQIVPYMGLNFMLHDVLVARLTKAGNGGSGASGLAGMAAGVVSKLLVFPMDTVKKRLQAEAFWGPADAGAGGGGGSGGASTRYDSRPPPSTAGGAGAPGERRVVGAVNRRLAGKPPPPPAGAPYGGMVDCFTRIARNEGAAAFYKGIFPSLVKSSVSTGASFWLFTLTRNLLRTMHDGKFKIA